MLNHNFSSKTKKTSISRPKNVFCIESNDAIDEVPVSSYSWCDGFGVVLSLFYGIFVICLTIVCVSLQYITTVALLDISQIYLNVLYLISNLWFICFGFSFKWGCNKHDAKEPVKSYFASNRWLKGVVAVFGFFIIINDLLEIIAITSITNPFCQHKTVYLLMPILHIPFIFGQVSFLFLFVKYHLQEGRLFMRLGIMHIMVTNLSVWIVSIAKEANQALAFEREFAENSSNNTRINTAGLLFQGNCTCSTTFCNRVVVAEEFLFPFLVEFCLVTCCLLYVSWRNVGKMSKEFTRVVRPNYKLFKAYKGPTFGALVVAATVTVIVLLGSVERKKLTEVETYLTQYNNLHLYEVFLMTCEVINLLACIFGVVLYLQLKRRENTAFEISLDNILLLVCFIGPTLTGLFSILCLALSSSETKAPSWEISLIYPCIDILTTAVQIIFIMFGLQQIAKLNMELRSPDQLQLESFDDKVFDDENSSKLQNASSTLHCMCSLPITNVKGKTTANDGVRSSSATITKQQSRNRNRSQVFEVRLSPPGGIRTLLRDILIFLLLSNASMWLFLSLDKTVFGTLTYQYEYYGHSIWTILTAVTSPLSIFLRMHSAACFFEMWSYA